MIQEYRTKTLERCTRADHSDSLSEPFDVVIAQVMVHRPLKRIANRSS
jgi:hypothetical protein